jgi:hypothetical protein
LQQLEFHYILETKKLSVIASNFSSMKVLIVPVESFPCSCTFLRRKTFVRRVEGFQSIVWRLHIYIVDNT